MIPVQNSLIITIAERNNKPWWWSSIDHETLGCALEHKAILVRGRKLTSPFSYRTIQAFIRVLLTLIGARRSYRYIVTFEGGWLSFMVALIQRVSPLKRPHHVVIQFIMREKTKDLRSRAKYVFMRWCLSSAHLLICSSRAEIEYYKAAFGWPGHKFAFVPFHTDPRFVASRGAVEEKGFAIAAGRTFRDYSTLIKAFSDLPVALTIVTSRRHGVGGDIPSNVTIVHDIPIMELTELMSRSAVVVLPLEDRAISIGQSVLLQAMALMKPVIATKVNGTEDYIEHMKTGILVPPNDANAIRKAVELLFSDRGLRLRLGRAAQEQVENMHLPNHYARGVSRCLGQRQSG